LGSEAQHENGAPFKRIRCINSNLFIKTITNTHIRPTTDGWNNPSDTQKEGYAMRSINNYAIVNTVVLKKCIKYYFTSEKV